MDWDAMLTPLRTQSWQIQGFSLGYAVAQKFNKCHPGGDEDFCWEGYVASQSTDI